MSNLSITEYEQLARGANGDRIPAGDEPSLVIQNVTFTTSSAQSAAFNSKTRFVRIISDVDARFVIGENPTASASESSLISAGAPEYFGVNPGDKIAIISAA